jgi:hypothetical protein
VGQPESRTEAPPGASLPLEALTPFYQAYAYWLPLRYSRVRSLFFYDGALDAARLEGGWRDSMWLLGGDGRSEAAGSRTPCGCSVAVWRGGGV